MRCEKNGILNLILMCAAFVVLLGTVVLSFWNAYNL